MMSTKLRALGLGLLAMLAVGAFGVMNATAEIGGDFESEVAHTIVKGFEGPGGAHQLHFIAEDGSEIGCDKDEYTGTTDQAVETEITINPNWSECYTTGSATKFDIDETGCGFQFTVSNAPESHKNTVHLECPPGVAGVTITHPSCSITVPPQTRDGVGYKTLTNPTTNKHEITLEITADEVTSHYEQGICVFLGTKHTAEMKGSVTVQGFDTENKQVHVTATG
jgi:hypothetical protein